MKLRSAIGVMMVLGCTAVMAQANPMQVRGMAAACSNCHGTQGVAQDGMETLAGQKQEDLTKKMMDFKTGKKPATVMHQLAKGFSDEQIQQLAAYYAALKK